MAKIRHFEYWLCYYESTHVIYIIKPHNYKCFEVLFLLKDSGELLRSKEEGGNTSSQYFIKYLSSVMMLKMYKKCTNAPFALFLMLIRTSCKNKIAKFLGILIQF